MQGWLYHPLFSLRRALGINRFPEGNEGHSLICLKNDGGTKKNSGVGLLQGPR